jgi:hypothetical protein
MAENKKRRKRKYWKSGFTRLISVYLQFDVKNMQIYNFACGSAWM